MTVTLLLRLERLASDDPRREHTPCIFCCRTAGLGEAYGILVTRDMDDGRMLVPAIVHGACATSQPWSSKLPEVSTPLPHGLIGRMNDLVALYGVFSVFESIRFILQYPDPEGPTATSLVSAERSLAREILAALSGRAWNLVARKKIPVIPVTKEDP